MRPATLLEDRWVVFLGGHSRQLGRLEYLFLKLKLRKRVRR